MKEVIENLNSSRDNFFLKNASKLDSIELDNVKKLELIIDELSDELLKSSENARRSDLFIELFGMIHVSSNPVYKNLYEELKSIFHYNESMGYNDLVINNQLDFDYLYLKKPPVSVIVNLSYWEFEMISEFANDCE